MFSLHLLEFLGLTLAFILNTATYLVAAGSLWGLRDLSRQSDDRPQADSVAEEITTLRDRIEKLEQKAILEALERNEWNKSRTAVQLGISYPNLLSKIKRYNIH